MALVLRGTVVTMDGDAPPLKNGAVYVTDEGRVELVQAASKPPPPGYSRARNVETGGFVYPGLVDLHSHMGYNALPLFVPPRKKYEHHDSWNSGEPYSRNVSWPSNVYLRAAPEATLKYAQVKALVGGTTALQGKPRASRTIDGWLVRVIDDEQFGQPGDYVHTAVIPREAPEDLVNEAKRLSKPGAVYIPHVAEGVPGSKVYAEFGVLSQGGCVHEGLIGIHGTALGGPDFAAIGSKQGSIVWSPYSNLWLYETTTDVALARSKNVRLSLGTDWAPSGTKHLLAELKVAAILNKTFASHDRLDARALCELVTSNPGDALAVAWGQRLGRIRADAEADLVVVAKRKANAYENLIAARELDVGLVLIGGKPYYGTAALMKGAGATGAESITIAGEKRKVVVRLPGRKDAEMTWKEVVADLERVRADPVAAWDEANGDLAAWGGSLTDPEAPLLLLGDMPDGDAELMGAVKEPPADLVMPPLDTLWHDAAFFATTKARNPTLGSLEDLYA